MTDDAVYAATARNRRAFADLVDSLDEDQLAAPSLCAGWPVRTVAGHLVSAAELRFRVFLVEVLKARGNLDRAIDRVARRTAQRPVPELTAALRALADNRSAPPGVGPHGPMTDALVHTADVAVPLGLPHDPEPGGVALGLGFVVGRRPPGFATRRRLDGLRFTAEDLAFSGGDGAEIRGRGIDLLVAACGRAAVLDRLTGPGVEVLRARL